MGQGLCPPPDEVETLRLRGCRWERQLPDPTLVKFVLGWVVTALVPGLPRWTVLD